MAVMASVRRTQEPMIVSNGASLNVVAVAILLGALAIGGAVAAVMWNVIPLIAAAVIGLLLAPAPKIAQQWERAIVLRFGRYIGLRGPGLFWIVPFIDKVSSVIDQRTIASGFAAEQTLTADTVPVNVDAVLFWMVHDAEKAALEVQDYARAVAWAAQTALRDIIGRTTLADLLKGREQVQNELQKLIDERRLPPVDQWNPEHCGHSEMRIARDGTRYHQGSPISRPSCSALIMAKASGLPDVATAPIASSVSENSSLANLPTSRSMYVR